MAVGRWREIFNTKGHKELLSGLYRSTKFFAFLRARLKTIKQCGSPPLCSYPFTIMVFVLLCVIFMRGFAVGRDVPIAPHRPVAVRNARV